jgi:hypothetical protein
MAIVRQIDNSVLGEFAEWQAPWLVLFTKPSQDGWINDDEKGGGVSVIREPKERKLYWDVWRKEIAFKP